jgi:hypothetical protein
MSTTRQRLVRTIDYTAWSIYVNFMGILVGLVSLDGQDRITFIILAIALDNVLINMDNLLHSLCLSLILLDLFYDGGHAVVGRVT